MSKRKLGIFGVKRSGYLGPFSKHANDLASESDSSDGDYNPYNTKISTEKVRKKRRLEKKRPTEPSVNNSRHASRNLKERDSCLPTDPIPEEILIQIFKYLLLDDTGIRHLCRSAQVCRQWSMAAKCPSLWQVVNLAFLANSKTANDNTVIKLIKRFPNIEELNVNGWTKLTHKSIMKMAECLTNLRGLNIGNLIQSREKVTSASLSCIARRFTLTKLDFSSVLTNPIILRAIVLKSKSDLTHISVSNCRHIGNRQLLLIQTNCNNLRTLDLSKTSLESIDIEDLQASCPKLEELYLTNLNLLPSRRCLLNQQGVSEGFPKLRALSFGSLDGGAAITDCFLKRTLLTSRKLKILDLRGCTKVTWEGIRHLEIDSLERLFMGRCRVNPAMVHIASSKWRSSLKELDFSHSHLTKVPIHRHSDTNFHNLATLDLAGSLVTDYDVSYFLEKCKSLVYLDLSLCRGVSRGLKVVHDIKSIERLKHTLVDWRSADYISNP